MPAPDPIVVTLQNDEVIVNGVTHDIGTLETVAGNRRSVWGTFTFHAEGSDYATGGMSIDPYLFGLSVLDRLECEMGKNGSDVGIEARLTTATPFKGSPNPATPQGLIQAFWCADVADPLLEVANATDLSTYVVPFTAYGVA